MVKNPPTPPRTLTKRASDITEYPGALWRIHRLAGAHRSQWNQFRDWGPVDARWDPHTPPPSSQPDNAVLYTAPDVITVFGEIFQHQRSITLSGIHNLTGWKPLRPLRLLNLTETWAVRNGASASLHAASKATCRSWAHAIHETWPELDGIWAPSTMTGRPMVALYPAALDALPSGPELSRPINHSALSAVIVEAARELGWPIRTA